MQGVAQQDRQAKAVKKAAQTHDRQAREEMKADSSLPKRTSSRLSLKSQQPGGPVDGLSVVWQLWLLPRLHRRLLPREAGPVLFHEDSGTVRREISSDLTVTIAPIPLVKRSTGASQRAWSRFTHPETRTSVAATNRARTSARHCPRGQRKPILERNRQENLPSHPWSRHRRGWSLRLALLEHRRLYRLFYRPVRPGHGGPCVRIQDL